MNIARIFASVAILLVAALLAGGCATSQPAPLTVLELAEAQTFSFYRVYWVGPRFGSYSLVAADGRQNYSSSVGDSVYYGNCLPGKTSALDGGGCELPLRVTTLIYTRQANLSLGAQRNTILRGVPAVIYNGGDTVELYSGRVAIEVFSDNLAEALRAIWGAAPNQRTRQRRRRAATPRLLSGPLRAAAGSRAGGAAGPARARMPEGRRHAEDRSGSVRQRLMGLRSRGVSGWSNEGEEGEDEGSLRATSHAARGLLRATSRPQKARYGLPAGRGRSGLPISPRRLRNATVPISAGTHSEIAR